MMTSSKYDGGDHHSILNDITNRLMSFGYEVIRRKVEIRPETKQHENFCYYESHIRLKLLRSRYDGHRNIILNKLCHLAEFHMSLNLFKEDAEYMYQMITYRSKTDTFHEFEEKIDTMGKVLNRFGFTCDKTELEECIYDSNIQVDAGWIDK